MPLCLLFIFALALTARAQGSTEAMLDYTASTESRGNPVYSPIFEEINGTVGWTFQATVNIDVTALGAFNYIVPHSGLEVGLWDSSGDLLAAETITTASSSVEQSRYQSIPPVMLIANQTYYLAAFSPAGTLQALVVAPDTAPNGYATMSPDIQLGKVAYGANSGFGFPSTTDGNPGDAIIAPNFEFQGVPEPPPGCLLGAGTIALLITCRQFKGAATGQA